MSHNRLKRFYTGAVWTFVKLGYTYRNMLTSKLSWAKLIYDAALKNHEQELLRSQLPAIFEEANDTARYYGKAPTSKTSPLVDKHFTTAYDPSIFDDTDHTIRQFKEYRAGKPLDPLTLDLQKAIEGYEGRAFEYAQDNPFFTIDKPSHQFDENGNPLPTIEDDELSELHDRIRGRAYSNWQFNEETRAKLPNAKISFSQAEKRAAKPQKAAKATKKPTKKKAKK